MSSTGIRLNRRGRALRQEKHQEVQHRPPLLQDTPARPRLTFHQAQHHSPQTETRHRQVENNVVSRKHDPIRDAAEAF